MKKTLIENQLSSLMQLRDVVKKEVFVALEKFDTLPTSISGSLLLIYDEVDETLYNVIDDLQHFRRVLGADFVNKATYRWFPNENHWVCKIYFTKEWEPYCNTYIFEESIIDECGILMVTRTSDDMLEFIKENISSIMSQYQLTELTLDEIPIVNNQV